MTSHSHTARKEAVEKAPSPLSIDEITRCVTRARNYVARSKKAQRMLALARQGFDQLPNHQRTRDLEDMIRTVEDSHG